MSIEEGIMKRSVAALAIVAGILAPALVLGAGAEVGDKAPDFTLTDQDGNQVTLSAIKGVRVLEWVNPDCPFVQRHYREGTMKRLAAEYAARGVTWLTINSTHYMNQETDREFRKAHGLEQPILGDFDGKVGHAYGAKTTPDMFVISSDGTIVYAGAIDDDPRGAKSSDRTDYVAQALDEVLAGKPVATPETRPYGCSVKYPQ
jgi:peroxiredoxin